MNVFDLREHVVGEYAEYVRGFIAIRDPKIKAAVDAELDRGLLWPDPHVGLTPTFERGKTIDDLIAEGVLHPGCAQIFRRKRHDHDQGEPLFLHRHQEEAIRRARQGHSFVLTTGTGSGKSLAYMVPIVDDALRHPGKGIKAIVVYPMNALANSQEEELRKFLSYNFPDGKGPVTFRRYTGQESDETREAIIQSPPDILLTNYVMLELILTRVRERALVNAAGGLRFLVFDELHTYRGRQGADVALLIRRTREATHAGSALRCVGTSATLASAGGHNEQRAEVARVAGQIFGTTFSPDDIIGETIRRATAPIDPRDTRIRQAVEAAEATFASYEEYIANPLSAWIEQEIGLQERDGRLVRLPPKPIRGGKGVGAALAELTGLGREDCSQAIERHLQAGYAPNLVHPTTGSPAFAFRLHQFLSRGETAWASLEDAEIRHVTVEGQRYVPGSDKMKLLFPLAFCRQCGAEYHSVTRIGAKGVAERYEPRDFDDRQPDVAGEEDGYLYTVADPAWPEADPDQRLPEDWLEETPKGPRVRQHLRQYVPRSDWVAPDGTVKQPGIRAHFVPRPFRFCLNCGVSYAGSSRSDFAKLGTLGSGGRSTATTIASLNTVEWLKTHDATPEAHKLLAFSDNRQDASLQAGHFNDYVVTTNLRSALHRAALAAGADGLQHDELAQRVFKALDLAWTDYGVGPEPEFAGPKGQTERAMRNLLGYRLYLDLHRGWRLSSPNLEGTGLLRFNYESLDELCLGEKHWASAHDLLARATPQQRGVVTKALLDHMRRELCIDVEYLTQPFQESLRQQSLQLLVEPWALDPQEHPIYSYILFPRSSTPQDRSEAVFLSGRSGFARFLRTQLAGGAKLPPADAEQIIRELLERLEGAAIVAAVRMPKDGVAGYQLRAAAIRWIVGEGKEGYRDPVRMPSANDDGVKVNAFFRDAYREQSSSAGLKAREHTAQVSPEQREQREDDFRRAALPVLYCSPTMELGVDIAQLHVVGMRNVPPSAANYAQRSGRAGRGGTPASPAFIFTYCSTGSTHDRYFFRRQDLMTGGTVSTPRIDLANEDLVRSHVDSIWLAQSHMSLGRGLADVLEVEGVDPSLDLKPSVKKTLDDVAVRTQTLARSKAVLGDIEADLKAADWWSDDWLERTIDSIPQRFQAACDRWRGLYRSAQAQAKAQGMIMLDATRPSGERADAQRRRAQAESQLDLLANQTDERGQQDFNSYRYFASEGFLPGYSFPRLPLTCLIPGRRTGSKDEYLQRPRFVAISEFGPRNVIYHEGSRYVVNQVQVPINPDAQGGAASLMTVTAKRCNRCGYLHEGGDKDTCDRCQSGLDDSRYDNLLRLSHVFARRRDRINSDEEERQRLGYEVLSALRFARRDGQESVRVAEISDGAGVFGRVEYGDAATIWRMNVGWRRRDRSQLPGYVLDIDRGLWTKAPEEDEDDANPSPTRIQRVIPFVEDRRNCLLISFAEEIDQGVLASLEAALRTAVAARHQLEDEELAAEPLPARETRTRILLYEAAEGGAGVLRRLVADPAEIAALARTALDLLHFNPATGDDNHRAPNATEDCAAACYDCLLSYRNQLDHPILDRHAVQPLLLRLAAATVAASAGPLPRAEHLQQLLNLCDSDLERQWLGWLDKGGYNLPDHAQRLIEKAGARPDFTYGKAAAVFIDGPFHDQTDHQARDAEKRQALSDLAYTVIAFHHAADWGAVVKKYEWLFGKGDEG